MTNSRFRNALDILVSFAMLGAALVLIVTALGSRSAAKPIRSGGVEALPSGPLTLAGVQFVGSQTAKVVIIEFSDYECPFCASFAKETWPILKTRFVDTGDVRFAYVHIPLDQHAGARPAAEVAECAGEQQRFWAVHDEIFRTPELATILKGATLDEFAGRLGLDVASLRNCVATTGRATVDRQRKWANELGISSTPTFLLGIPDPSGAVQVKSRLNGAYPLDKFAEAIDTILK